MVDRLNQTLKDQLAKCICESGGEWDKYLPQVELAYNSSVHSVLGFLLSFLHMVGNHAYLQKSFWTVVLLSLLVRQAPLQIMLMMWPHVCLIPSKMLLCGPLLLNLIRNSSLTKRLYSTHINLVTLCFWMAQLKSRINWLLNGKGHTKFWGEWTKMTVWV